MTPVQAGAFLTIDLKAIAENRRSLQAHLGNGTECAAVLKADAYGLGAAAVAKELYRTGCRQADRADARADRNNGLNGSFAERTRADDDGAFMVLQSAGNDFGCRSRTFVN